MGTSIVRISLEEAVNQAQWIVEGQVVRNWCDWDSGHRFIWTHTEISVRDRWKGSMGSTVTVSEPGGTVNGMGLSVPGMVRYSAGEHVVLFLFRTPIGYIRTLGLAQGKLLVDTSGRVHPTASDGPLVSAAGATGGTSISVMESMSLATARQRISRMTATAGRPRQ